LAIRPLPAHGRGKIESRSRDAASHPSYETPRSRYSLTRHHRTLIRWSTLSSRRQTLGGKRLICFTAAWIAGSSPAMTNGTNGKERKKRFGGETPTDAMKYSAVPDGHGRCPHPNPPPLAGEGMGGGSTSIGVPPRLSSQGVFHRKGLSTRLLLPGTWRPGLACPSSGRYPLLPVPVQRGHRAPVVVPRG
jgi:hypothetical protein